MFLPVPLGRSETKALSIRDGCSLKREMDHQKQAWRVTKKQMTLHCSHSVEDASSCVIVGKVP